MVAGIVGDCNMIAGICRRLYSKPNMIAVGNGCSPLLP